MYVYAKIQFLYNIEKLSYLIKFLLWKFKYILSIIENAKVPQLFNNFKKYIFCARLYNIDNLDFVRIEIVQKCSYRNLGIFVEVIYIEYPEFMEQKIHIHVLKCLVTLHK